MKVLLVDPGLNGRTGHNGALAEELDRELSGRVDFRIAGNARVRADDFRDLRAPISAAFRVSGYAKYAARQLADSRLMSSFRSAIDEDLAALDIDACDLILMPTVYPLHLEALARRAGRLQRQRLTFGMLMPPEYWAADASAAAAVEQIMLDAVQHLYGQTDALFYSETGAYHFGAQRISMPLLLPPVSAATGNLLARLEREAANPAETTRFGFFGAPFPAKGFDHLLGLARHGVPDGAQLVVRLPAGHEDICSRLNALSPHIDARSQAMTNADYLQQMAQVDVVLAAYDPEHYALKMSGIVPEAICLGRSVLVTDGCTALVDFLDRHAPGSFATQPYGVNGLAAAMALPATHWQRLAHSARASAAVMRSLKEARRYLALAGVDTASHQRGNVAHEAAEAACTA
jgi:hypothetical protein